MAAEIIPPKDDDAAEALRKQMEDLDEEIERLKGVQNHNMTETTVETKRGGFGSRIKSLLRGGGKKSVHNEGMTMAKESPTPTTEDPVNEKQPEPVQAEESPPPAKEGGEEEEVHTPSPEADPAEEETTPPQEQSFTSEYTSDEGPSLQSDADSGYARRHILTPIAVVPVDLNPKKQNLSTDTESTGTRSTASGSDPAAENDPTNTSGTTLDEESAGNSYNRDQFNRSPTYDYESLSLMSFDTGRSKDGLLTYLGNVVDQQWKALENTIGFVEDDQAKQELQPELQPVQSVESVIVEGTENIEYVRADSELLATRGRSMDSKVASGVTTPSAGTRVISNSPRKNEQSKPSSNDDKSIDDSLPSVEDRLIQHEPVVEPPRDVSPEANDGPTNVTNDESIMGILRDLNAYPDDPTESPTVESSISNSVPSDDAFAQQFDGFDAIFGCGPGDCDFVKQCVFESGIANKRDLASPVTSPEEYRKSRRNSTKKKSSKAALPPCTASGFEDTTSKGSSAEDDKSHPEQSDDSQAGPQLEDIEEASLERSIEQTLADSTADDFRKVRSMNSATTSSVSSPGRRGILRRFRSDLPKFNKAAANESDLQGSRTDNQELETSSSAPQETRSRKGLSLFRGSRSRKSNIMDSAESESTAEHKHRSLFSRFSIKKKKDEEPSTPKRDNTSAERENAKNNDLIAVDSDSLSPDYPDHPPEDLMDNHQLGRSLSSPGRLGRVPSSSVQKVRSALAKKEDFYYEVTPPGPSETEAPVRTSRKSSGMDIKSTPRPKRRGQDPDAPKTGEERPLKGSDMKHTSSLMHKTPQRPRKVHFSRTPLILQRLQSSRPTDPEDDEDASFLLEDTLGMSLQSSSWLDEDETLPVYMSPQVDKNVLMTSHAIPKNPAPSPPVQLYGDGSKEFDEFD